MHGRSTTAKNDDTNVDKVEFQRIQRIQPVHDAKTKDMMSNKSEATAWKPTHVDAEECDNQSYYGRDAS